MPNLETVETTDLAKASFRNQLQHLDQGDRPSTLAGTIVLGRGREIRSRMRMVQGRIQGQNREAVSILG